MYNFAGTSGNKYYSAPKHLCNSVWVVLGSALLKFLAPAGGCTICQDLKYLTQILNMFGIPSPEFLFTEFHRNIDYTGIDDM